MIPDGVLCSFGSGENGMVGGLGAKGSGFLGAEELVWCDDPLGHGELLDLIISVVDQKTNGKLNSKPIGMHIRTIRKLILISFTAITQIFIYS